MLALCVCTLVFCVPAFAEPHHTDSSSASPTAFKMAEWDKTRPYSFSVANITEGVFLTIAQSSETADPGAPTFYLAYDPDDDGSDKVECYTVTSNSSKDELGEGAVTLKPDTVYAVSAQNNTLILTAGDTVLFSCVIPADRAPTGGRYEPPTFAQEFASCNRIGLGLWEQGIDQYALKSNKLTATTEFAGSGGTDASSEGTSSTDPSSSQESAPPSSAVSELPSQPEPASSAAPHKAETAGGLWSSLLRNPVVWVGAAAVLVLLVLIAVLLLRRKGKKSFVTSDQGAPPPPEAADNPYQAAAPNEAAPRFSSIANVIEVSKPGGAAELSRRMQEYDRGPSVFSSEERAESPKLGGAQARPAPPAPIAPVPTQAAGDDPAGAAAAHLLRLYTDAKARDGFNESQAGYQFLDVDDKTAVSLHYHQQADYRLALSPRSYLAADFVLVDGRYLFLNYFRFNEQKGNFRLNSSLKKDLHLEYVYEVEDGGGQRMELSSLPERPILSLSPAQVKQDADGYLLTAKGRIRIAEA